MARPWGADPRRRAEHGGRRRVAPAAPIGRETAVVVAIRRRQLADGNGSDGVLDDELEALAPALPLQSALSPLRVAACVVPHDDRLGGGRTRNAHHLLDRITAADDEVAAKPAKRLAQVGERVPEEEPAVRAGGGSPEGVVEDEQRNDRATPVGGCAEGARSTPAWARMTGAVPITLPKISSMGSRACTSAVTCGLRSGYMSSSVSARTRSCSANSMSKPMTFAPRAASSSVRRAR